MSEKRKYTTRWVSAPAREVKKKKKVRVQVGTKRVEMTKGLIKKESFWEDRPDYETREQWVGTGKFLPTEVDLEEFSRIIQQVCDELCESGYLIDRVIPIDSGRYETNANTQIIGQGGAGWGWGYGYSVTDKVIIIGKLADES